MRGVAGHSQMTAYKLQAYKLQACELQACELQAHKPGCRANSHVNSFSKR